MSSIDIYLDILADLGFRPELTSSGNVMFKYENFTYHVYANDSDEVYFQMVCHNFWEIETAEELQRALFYTNEVSRDTKVAKLYVTEDETQVSAAIELFVAETEYLRPVFGRMLNTLKWAVHDFMQRMRASAQRARQEAQKALVRRWLQEGFGQGVLALADDLFATDYVERGGMATLAPLRGPEGARAIAGALRAAFADLKVAIITQVIEGEQIMTHWTLSGAQRAPFMDLLPTGQAATCNAVRMDTFREGRIAESWTIVERPVTIPPTC